ncbi:MAG: hypothetical protein ACR2P4_08185 [Gammaproteobacteria bacterium]
MTLRSIDLTLNSAAATLRGISLALNSAVTTLRRFCMSFAKAKTTRNSATATRAKTKTSRISVVKTFNKVSKTLARPQKTPPKPYFRAFKANSLPPSFRQKQESMGEARIWRKRGGFCRKFQFGLYNGDNLNPPQGIQTRRKQ